MSRALYLYDVLRAADVPVIRHPGWEFRGSSSIAPAWQVFHHTASNRHSGNMPSLSIVVNGRSDLPGPLCNVLVGRDGTCVVVASGRANHAGEGRYPDGVTNDNGHSLGWECENDGLGEPWPAQQIDRIGVGMAKVARRNGWPLTGTWAGRVVGHREYAPDRKIDPAGVNLAGFRSRIQSWADGGFTMDDEARRRFDTLEEIVRNQGQAARAESREQADRVIDKVWAAASRIIDVAEALIGRRIAGRDDNRADPPPQVEP